MTLKEIATKLRLFDYREDIPDERLYAALMQSLFFNGIQVTHKKSSDKYFITGLMLNCTNAQDEQWMIRYEKPRCEYEFVREAGEFFEKFELLSNEH